MSIPIRADKSKVAKATLKKHSQEIFVYIEDEKMCHIYECLISRMLDIPREKILVQSFKAKRNVISNFEIWDNSKESPYNSIFIVDRDFDHLLQGERTIKIPKSKHFLELDRYTIENYLVEEKGTVELIRTKLGSNAHDIKIELEFLSWLNYFYRSFEKLFIAFGIAHRYQLMANNGTHMSNYLQKGSYLIDDKKVEEYIKGVKKRCIELNINYDVEYMQVKDAFLKNGIIEYEKLSHGKFKLFCLLKYIKHKFNKQYDEEMSKSILAERMELNCLRVLQEKCEEIIVV